MELHTEDLPHIFVPPEAVVVRVVSPEIINSGQIAQVPGGAALHTVYPAPWGETVTLTEGRRAAYGLPLPLR